jgi:hypothetical protein
MNESESGDPSRRARDLEDQLAAAIDELQRVEEALRAAQEFASQQAQRATQLDDELRRLRGTRTFRYTAFIRRPYSRLRRLLGR